MAEVRARRFWMPVLLIVAVVGALTWWKLSIIVVDNFGARKTLVIIRPDGDFRFIDSPAAICKRRLKEAGIASPSDLERGSCAVALLGPIVTDEEKLIVRLPFSQWLYDLAR